MSSSSRTSPTFSPHASLRSCPGNSICFVRTVPAPQTCYLPSCYISAPYLLLDRAHSTDHQRPQGSSYVSRTRFLPPNLECACGQTRPDRSPSPLPIPSRLGSRIATRLSTVEPYFRRPRWDASLLAVVTPTTISVTPCDKSHKHLTSALVSRLQNHCEDIPLQKDSVRFDLAYAISRQYNYYLLTTTPKDPRSQLTRNPSASQDETRNTGSYSTA